eukprot:1266681-Heterocapsa_arctica.AAC.1
MPPENSSQDGVDEELPRERVPEFFGIADQDVEVEEDDGENRDQSGCGLGGTMLPYWLDDRLPLPAD